MPLKPHPTNPDKMVYVNAEYNLPKPWVELTDEEIKPIIQKVMAYYGYKPEHSMLTSGAGFYALARAVLAKSKEKNT